MARRPRRWLLLCHRAARFSCHFIPGSSLFMWDGGGMQRCADWELC
jgi:hypothetical protein